MKSYAYHRPIGFRAFMRVAFWLAAGFIMTPVLPAQTVLTPTADAYVRDGSSAATNFGTATTLVTKTTTDIGFTRWSYLKFDLSTISGNITSGKLRLFGAIAGTSSTNVPVAVFSVSDTSWSETGITWNNKPAPGTTALATATVANATGQYYEWEVGTYLQGEKSAGRNRVSLV